MKDEWNELNSTRDWSRRQTFLRGERDDDATHALSFPRREASG